MTEIYLEVVSIAESCLMPVESAIVLFTYKYCGSSVKVNFIKRQGHPKERLCYVSSRDLDYKLVEPLQLPNNAKLCHMPCIVIGENHAIAGLCACLRQIIRIRSDDDPSANCRGLLGFKESCLQAHSESSVWTKFCEVEIVKEVKDTTVLTTVPISLSRFEHHMSQPVRLHNAYKTNAKKNSTEKNERILPEHSYAEGPTETLADIILFVCTSIFLSIYQIENAVELIPLTMKWYERMSQNSRIMECLSNLPQLDSQKVTVCSAPVVPAQSLYKSDPKRYKPRNRIFTRQDDIENSLKIIKDLGVTLRMDVEPFASEIAIDWQKIPYQASPKGGALPISRLERKYRQLENLCKPVMKLATDGDVIVDFCSGGGHLGILMAYLLPRCTVILLENKDESLKRARERVEMLNLDNVKFCQCNLDYFKGDFNIGTSLHACGVATDLVIEQCIRKNAVFVSCPCCYGGLHDSHHITFPRSKLFEAVNNRDYMIIGHAADQTHDSKNTKTNQGYECMTIVDTDRKLFAEQFGYTVYLTKLKPQDCTLKNHLLVGIPKTKFHDYS